MTAQDLEGQALYTTNGKDVWRMQFYCLTPYCSLKNLETGEVQSFGMGGHTADSFKKLVPQS